MKKTISFLLIAATLITACKKNNPNNPATPSVTQPVVLISKITDNTPGHAAFGKPIDIFTYNGKQLTKVVSTAYNTNGSISNVETDLFNYNAQGQLTGTTITNTDQNPTDIVSSVVTYTGSNITDIKCYQASNVLDDEVTTTYINGKLTGYIYSYPGSAAIPHSYTKTHSYIYYSNNQCSSILYVSLFYSGANYTGVETIGYSQRAICTTFDSEQNVNKAVPFWLYCENRFHLLGGFDLPPSLNNPINIDFYYPNSTSSSSNKYLYNTDGYPTTITYSEPYNSSSYNYEYIKAN